MKRSLLPLTALRAFEAAGRHQSFKRAAEELAVSEAAISRQVRDLEAILGTPLFTRGFRAVTLTDAGETLSKQLDASFNAISDVLTSIAAPPPTKLVRVSVEPTFAAIFLIPRLAGFTAAHPEIEIQIESSSDLVDMHRGDVDLAIRYSLNDTVWPGSQSQHLADNVLTPMMAPRLAEPNGRPIDVLAAPLLRDENEGPWGRWLDKAKFPVAPRWGPTFSNAAIALQSAELGHGIALGDRTIAATLLQTRRLVAPFAIEIENGAYWLIGRDLKKLTSSQIAFCEWLRSQLADESQSNY